MDRFEVYNHIKDYYNVEPDFPWIKYPQYAVFRHQRNKKWFALIMNIKRSTLKIDGEGTADVINLKTDPLFIGSLQQKAGVLPAYHMSKKSWVTVLLDGSFDKQELFCLIDESFNLTQK